MCKQVDSLLSKNKMLKIYTTVNLYIAINTSKLKKIVNFKKEKDIHNSPESL